jgi:hypothetical protein
MYSTIVLHKSQYYLPCLLREVAPLLRGLLVLPKPAIGIQRTIFQVAHHSATVNQGRVSFNCRSALFEAHKQEDMGMAFEHTILAHAGLLSNIPV